MPRQLTPEELKIIRQTEEEGAELARRKPAESKSASAWHRATSLIALALIFILIAGLTYLIVSATAA